MEANGYAMDFPLKDGKVFNDSGKRLGLFIAKTGLCEIKTKIDRNIPNK